MLKCAITPAESNKHLLELIITSCRALDFQKKLLNKGPGFSLEEALRLGRTYETTASHIQQLSDMKSPTSVQAIRTNTCKNCGGRHAPRKCPAYKSKCHSCGKDNHWAKICRSKPPTSTNDSPKQPKSQLSKRQHGYRKGTRKVHNIEAGQADGDSDFDVLTFNDIMVSSMKSSRDEAFVTVNVKLTSRPGIHNLILKVDTGAQDNTLPLATFRRMFPNKLDSRFKIILLSHQRN